MNISASVLASAANLLHGGAGEAPVGDEVEWKGFDADEAEALEAILDEVTWDDMYAVAQAAAVRLGQRRTGEAE